MDTENKDSELMALEMLLDMTSIDDWYLIHNTVRNRSMDGNYTPEFERRYKEMVDKKVDEHFEKESEE